MSSTPKQIEPESRETVDAEKLVREGKRVTIDYTGTFLGASYGYGLGFILNGTVYRSPGIGAEAFKETKDHRIIRDGGQTYDSAYA